jgi:ribosomal protein L16 Arg81 hydroxylase
MPCPEYSLSEILSPFSTVTFFEEYWEKDALHVARESDRYYLHLFSRRDLDALLWKCKPTWGAVQLANHKRGADWIDFTSTAPEPATLRRAYDQGDSIVVNNLQNLWPPITAFARNLEGIFGFCVNVNAYLTPPDSQGLSAHYDTEDGFVLQVEGSKRWRLFRAERALPLADDFQEIGQSVAGLEAREVCLKPGDLLYLPRGIVHEALTAARPSLHLTVTINAVRWVNLLEVAILSALKAVSEEDLDCRRALPVGWLWHPSAEVFEEHFANLLGRIVRRVNSREGLEELACRFIGELGPLPGGFFSDTHSDDIDLDSMIERRNGMLCLVTHHGNRARIQFPGGGLEVPAAIEPALRTIATLRHFAVRSLSGTLSDDSKLLLIRRLIQDGLLVRLPNIARSNEAPPQTDEL